MSGNRVNYKKCAEVCLLTRVSNRFRQACDLSERHIRKSQSKDLRVSTTCRIDQCTSVSKKKKKRKNVGKDRGVSGTRDRNGIYFIIKKKKN